LYELADLASRAGDAAEAEALLGRAKAALDPGSEMLALWAATAARIAIRAGELELARARIAEGRAVADALGLGARSVFARALDEAEARAVDR
jgi:hypothetical protein